MLYKTLGPILLGLVLALLIREAATKAASRFSVQKLSAVVSSASSQKPKDTNSYKEAQSQQEQKAATDKKAAYKKKTVTNSVAGVKPNRRPNYIGIFVSDAPENPQSISHLREVASLGFNVVYNYSSFDGTPAQVNAYLDMANQLGVKVVFSLKDLYDQLPNGAAVAAGYSSYGSTNDEIAANVVKLFGPHPATWGFAITDEAPSGPADLSAWQTTLNNRYKLVKSYTQKPVMEVLLSYSAGTSSARQSFLRSLKTSTDNFALDYYPLPYFGADLIATFARDEASVDNNSWFIIQAFSWSQYPQTANSLGYDLSIARAPTTDEMVSMAATAINNGSRNIFFYSYFDLTSAAQKQSVKAAVSQLKN